MSRSLHAILDVTLRTLYETRRQEAIVRQLIDEAFPVVHILRGGYPLCGFNLARPEYWPPGQTWISCFDPEVRVRCNCEDCKEELGEAS
jgi:hypothetical protein